MALAYVTRRALAISGAPWQSLPVVLGFGDDSRSPYGFALVVVAVIAVTVVLYRPDKNNQSGLRRIRDFGQVAK